MDHNSVQDVQQRDAGMSLKEIRKTNEDEKSSKISRSETSAKINRVVSSL